MKAFPVLVASAALTFAFSGPAAAHKDTPGMQGEHDMSGTVSKLDKKKGTLVLATGAGPLHLHFPPDAVKDVKNGDKITVHLSLTKEEASAK